MNIHIVTPYYTAARGNSVTTRRIANALRSAGATVAVTALDEVHVPSPLPQSDIIHGFHAYRVYAYLLKTGAIHRPFVITLTGTDLNHDIHAPARADSVRNCLVAAHAIHVFSEIDRQRLQDIVPDVAHKVHSVAQGVASALGDRQEMRVKDTDERVILLPAGIRRVKNIRFAINACKRLHDKHPNVRLWIVGTVIEEDEWRWLQLQLASERAWLKYLGVVAHEQMANLYAAAHLVINTSVSEGQPIAILEAMAEGVPVLVSDIPGNRGIVTDGQTGLLFQNADDFQMQATALLTDCDLRRKLVRQAKRFVKEQHDVEKEAQHFLRIYADVIAASRA